MRIWFSALVGCALLAVLLASTGCGQQGEDRDRWNRVFSSKQSVFPSGPNAFLAEVVSHMRPGSALDLGMGEGRNALFLAQKGWDVTGVDFAEVGVAHARERAAKLGVKLNAVLMNVDDFDFGKERWDLVLLLYFPPRPYVNRIYSSLKPGGLVIVEVFHRESAESRHFGDGVVFGSNDLLKIFDGFRILHYEDLSAESDFEPGANRGKTRLIRLLGQKS